MNCATNESIPEIDLEHLLGLETPVIWKLIVVGKCRGCGSMTGKGGDDFGCQPRIKGGIFERIALLD